MTCNDTSHIDTSCNNGTGRDTQLSEISNADTIASENTQNIGDDIDDGTENLDGSIVHSIQGGEKKILRPGTLMRTMISYSLVLHQQ